MTIQEALIKLSDFIMFDRGGHKYGSGWIGTVCPFHPQPSKSKMYIYIPKNSDEHVIMKCFKPSCEIARSVRDGDLEKFGFKNKEACDIIYEHNKSKSSIKVKSKYTTGSSIDLYIPEVPTPEVAEYFRSRTRYNLTAEYVHLFNIIPNMDEFVKNNTNKFSDEVYTKLTNLVYRCNNGLIGFLNKNGNKLIIRSIKKGTNIKMNIDLVSTDQKLEPYYLNTPINNDMPRNIVIAEGTFDIINSYLNYVGIPNSEYVACLGSNLNADLIKRITFGNEYVNVVLIIDNIWDNKKMMYTRPMEHIDRLVHRVLSHISENIYIVYNNSGKDLGDMGEVHLPKKEKIK